MSKRIKMNIFYFLLIQNLIQNLSERLGHFKITILAI